MSRQHLNCVCKKSDSVNLSPTFKSNLDEVVKNIALESKKSNYNSEIDLNWCNLPTEMRLECLKHLDFKTRCGFRGVSKTEKALVDSKKYKFKHLQIFYKGNVDYNGIKKWDTIAKSGNKEPELHIRTDDRLNEKCLSAIFKYAEVENFRLYSDQMPKCDVRPILEQLKNFAPFPFKRVAVFNNPGMDFFLQNCVNLEKIDAYHDLPYKEMLSLPSLIEIKEFKFRGVIQPYFLEFLPRLVLKWIENDVEAGKSVQCLIAQHKNGERSANAPSKSANAPRIRGAFADFDGALADRSPFGMARSPIARRFGQAG